MISAEAALATSAATLLNIVPKMAILLLSYEVALD